MTSTSTTIQPHKDQTRSDCGLARKPVVGDEKPVGDEHAAADGE